MITRALSKSIKECLGQFPVCAIIGSRQVGKTTLAKSLAEETFPGNHIHLDLENPQDLGRLSEPQLYLEKQREKLVIIDEIQRKPELFPLLRFLVDQGGFHFLALRPFEWKELEASAMEQDGDAEIFKVPKPTRIRLDQLNLGVEPLRRSV